MRMQARRSVSLLLVLALMLSLSVCAFAAGASSLSLSLAAPAKNQGIAEILVNAEKAGTVADGKLTVTYDPAALQFVSAELGTAWPEGSDVSLKVNAAEAGKLVIAFASVYEANKGDALVLSFRVLKETSSEVTMTDAAGGQSKLTVSGVCPCDPFTDVNKKAWYHAAVDYAVSMGYMNGVSADSFKPNGVMDRGMLVTVLYRMAGSPSVAGMENPFTDLTKKWYKNAVIWAYNEGITTGTSKTTFTPDRSVTREETATFLFRYADHVGVSTSARADLSGYSDSAKIGRWFKDSMSWAVAVGLIKGTSTTTLSPNATATRATIAQILMNFDQKVLG